MPKLCKQYGLCWTFPSESLDLGYIVGRGPSVNNPSHLPSKKKNLSTMSLRSFPGRQHCHNLPLKKVSTSCVTPLGENSWKLEPDFFWTSPPCTLSYCWFCFIAFHCYNSQSWQWLRAMCINYMLSSVHPSESLDLGPSWGPPTQLINLGL